MNKLDGGYIQFFSIVAGILLALAYGLERIGEPGVIVGLGVVVAMLILIAHIVNIREP